jgi:FKBP-type peptidyl-prolyl cis-trans isomerase 2
MAIKKHDFVCVDYTGKLNGSVFDTSLEDVAKKGGFHDAQRKYAPLVLGAGEGDVIKGFDEALMGMEKGQSKHITIPPQLGYGERKPDLVKVMPTRVFEDHKLNPAPGMLVTLDDLPARVQSVSGGRVRVDFNHELAGKTLEFDITVRDVITDDKGKIKALAASLFIDGDVALEVEGKTVKVAPKPMALTTREYGRAKAYFVSEISKRFPDYKIEFLEKFEKATK